MAVTAQTVATRRMNNDRIFAEHDVEDHFYDSNNVFIK